MDWGLYFDFWLLSFEFCLLIFDFWLLTCDFWLLTCDIWLLELLEHLHIFNERVYFYWNTNVSECCSQSFLFSYWNFSFNLVISIGTPPYLEAHIYLNSIAQIWGGLGVGRVEKQILFQINPCHVDSVDIHQNKEENAKGRKIELIESC